jgi:hypothetical protein
VFWNLSTATSAANFCRSLRFSGSFSAVSRASVIALSEEMKTVDTKWVPSRARTTQAALSASTVREAAARCRSARRVRRTTAKDISTGTHTSSSTAPTSTSRVDPLPMESSRKLIPSSSSTQSSTGLNGRARAV